MVTITTFLLYDNQTGFFRSWYIKLSTYANTSLCVCKGKNVVMIRNGQVTQGAKIIKPNVKKIYRLGANVIGGNTSSLTTTLLPIQQIGNVILN